MDGSRSSRVSGRPFWSVLSVLLIALIGLSGCGVGGAATGSALVLSGSHPSASAHKIGGTVTIDNVNGSLWTCSFNPYSSSSALLAAGILYEPLYYVNSLNNSTRPWLATRYRWGKGNQTLTFTMRKGVKWTDGKALTAADVAFTFNLEKKFSGLDLQAVWSVLSSVKAHGSTVVFTFKHAAVPFFYYIADQNYILPQHLWSKIKNPVTYTDSHPVGSGPFKVQSCSPQNITYVRNPHYWQSGRPYISKVQYPAFMGNNAGNLYLADGKANWGGQFIPNINTYYLSRDRAHRHNWDPPATNDIGLFENLKQAPLNNVKVRQALSYAINRSTVSRLGVYGYLPPADQTGIILPNDRSWFDKNLSTRYGYNKNFGYNPGKAKSLLRSAGYKLSGGFFTKGGKRLSLSIINVGGFTDWVAEVKIITDQLRAIGVNASAQNLSDNDYLARGSSGHFQLAYGAGNLSGGPTPYYFLRQLLDSGNIGNSNWSRYRSTSLDRLFDQYSATNNSGRQHSIIRQVESTMVSQVPFVAVLEDVNWFQYDTSQIVGWPTPSNPYANPAPYNTPDMEVVLTRVHLK